MSDDKIKKLFNECKLHDQAYYNKGESTLSDAQYDLKREKLESKVKKIKDVVLRAKVKSYLKGIGAKVRESKRNVTLPFLIGSLAKVTKDKLQRLKALIKTLSLYDFVLGPKIDGTSITLKYSKGKLVDAYSRGDGVTGQSKIEHIKQIQGIPHKIGIVDTIFIRGEAVLNENLFNKKFKDKEINGKIYKEARNACTGWINSDDIENEISKSAMFIAYELLNEQGDPYKSTLISNKITALTYLNSIFKYPYVFIHIKENISINELINKLEEALVNARKEFPFQTDGLVFEINSYLVRKAINENNKTKYPKFAIAYKESAKDAAKRIGISTQVTEVTRTVNNIGLNFPTVWFKPIKIGNSKVQKASGKSYKDICAKGLKKGVELIVVKSGGVIPEIFVANEIKRISPPEKCLCGAPAKMLSTKGKVPVHLYCTKPHKCEYVKRAVLKATLKSMKLTGLGKKNIDKLFEAGFLDIESLLTAKDKKILKIEGFGDSILATIKKGIPQKLKSMSKAQLMECSGVFVMPGLALAKKTLEEINSGKTTEGLRYELYVKRKSDFKEWYSNIKTYL